MPAFRANWTRTVLAAAESRLPAEAYARARDRIGPEAISRLDHAGPLEWLPAEAVHVPVSDAILEAIGAAPSRGFWRDVVADNLGGRLFKAVFEGTRRAFGTEPHDLLRALPISWEIIARGAGKWQITPDLDLKTVGVVWSEVHPMLLRGDSFVFAMQGTIDAIVASGGGRGAVTVELGDRVKGKVAYRYRWT